MESHFVVLGVRFPEGERFALWRPDAFQWWEAEEWWEATDRQFKALPWVTEDDVRSRLAEMGLSDEVANEKIERARRIVAMNVHSSIKPFIGRITRIGYRNPDSQEVIRKTDLSGSSPGQRVFVIRCGDCAHEYGANGCDIDRCRCPKCQGGGQGLPTSHMLG